MRILLADDQKEIRLLTTAQLERSGHQVVAVANGLEALHALQREPFDVVLMDEDMPVMNGLQALRAIRERATEFGPMVLIALTGYNTEPDRERLLRAGFDSVIGKPFHLEELDALFKVSAERKTSGERERQAPARAQSPIANLLGRVGADEKLARTIVTTFLRDSPKRMAGIQKALQRKDSETLASLAHALKGSVSIFGAHTACDLLQQLPVLGRGLDSRELARVYEQLKEEIAELEESLRGYAGQKSPRSSGASARAKRRSPSLKRKST